MDLLVVRSLNGRLVVPGTNSRLSVKGSLVSLWDRLDVVLEVKTQSIVIVSSIRIERELRSRIARVPRLIISEFKVLGSLGRWHEIDFLQDIS